MTDKLYIIGNGFDLHHNLKTSYYDFAKYLKENDKDLFETLESYISFPIEDSCLWARFEENLANLDAEEILSEHTDYLPDYSSDEFRDRDRHAFPDIMDQFYKKLTEGLLESFLNFIQKVETPPSSEEQKLKLSKEAFFLTFNYTNTLEKLYGINKNCIKYIHNSAYYGSEQIILGHGIDPSNFEDKKPEPPANLSPEEMQDWYDQHDDYDYSFDTGKETLMRYFKTTFKPTIEIISKNKLYFESLNKVKELYVLGHSISQVDRPYFIELKRSVDKDTKWNVSYYNESEKQRHLITLNQLGVDLANINLFQLHQIQEGNNQMEIDF